MPRFFMVRDRGFALDETRVRAGALVFTSIEEMTERGKPTDANIQSLNRDILNTLVYGDPATLRASALRLRDDAKVFDTTIPGKASALRKDADELDLESSINEARIKGKDPERVNRETTYSQSFFTFRNNWNAFYDTVKSGDAFGSMSGNDVASMIDSYDAQYRVYVKGYNDLGLVTSVAPLPKSGAGDTTLPPGVAASAKGLFDVIPWGTLALVGAVGIGGYVVYKVASSKKDDAPASKEIVVVQQPSEAKAG